MTKVVYCIAPNYNQFYTWRLDFTPSLKDWVYVNGVNYQVVMRQISYEKKALIITLYKPDFPEPYFFDK